MERTSEIKSFLFSLKNIDMPVSVGGILLYFFSLAALFFISAYFKIYLFVLAGMAGLIFFTVCVIYPRFWIYSILGFSIFFLRGSSEGISILDVGTGGFYIGTLFIWLFWKIAVERERLIQNFADWMILFLYAAMLFTVFISLNNNVDFLDWLREYAIFTVLMFYFPIRYYFTDKKDLTRLLILFALVVVAADLSQFYMYYKATFSNLMYAYQLKSSVRLNQSLFSCAFMFGVLFALRTPSRWRELLLWGFTYLTFAALITSFSRTFWILAGFEVIILAFYLPRKQAVKMTYYFLTIAVIFTFSVITVFKDNAEIAFQVMSNRITSSVEGKKDVSVQSRLSEWDYVESQIMDSPLGGNGLGKGIHFYEKIRQETNRTKTIHNGYLFFFFRMGIPLSLFILVPIFFYMFKAESLARRSKDGFFRTILLGAAASLLLMVVAAMTNSAFVYRDGLFVLLLSFAFIGIAEENIRKNPRLLRKD